MKLLRAIHRFASSMRFAFLCWWARRIVLAPEAVRAQRQATCSFCEHWRGGFCGQCGCLIALKVKLKHERCPIGKWGAMK